MELGLKGKTAVVTGGGGAIGGAIAAALSREGVRIAVWDLRDEAAIRQAKEIEAAGGTAVAVACDVTDRTSVAEALASTKAACDRIDILFNVAGGSVAAATTSETQSFFDLLPESMAKAIDLNYLSSVRCCQAIGREFADQSAGAIVNVTSIAGLRPLTRAVSYSDSKAAFNSFTRWLAVHMALEYSPKIRVNAIAPGFLITTQNRFLIVDEKAPDGLTARGRAALSQVPFRRFGEPDEICGAALWLVSNQAAFVTGTVIPVDGGFMAYAGV